MFRSVVGLFIGVTLTAGVAHADYACGFMDRWDFVPYAFGSDQSGAEEEYQDRYTNMCLGDQIDWSKVYCYPTVACPGDWVVTIDGSTGRDANITRAYDQALAACGPGGTLACPGHVTCEGVPEVRCIEPDVAPEPQPEPPPVEEPQDCNGPVIEALDATARDLRASYDLGQATTPYYTPPGATCGREYEHGALRATLSGEFDGPLQISVAYVIGRTYEIWQQIPGLGRPAAGRGTLVVDVEGGVAEAQTFAGGTIAVHPVFGEYVLPKWVVWTGEQADEDGWPIERPQSMRALAGDQCHGHLQVLHSERCLYFGEFDGETGGRLCGEALAAWQALDNRGLVPMLHPAWVEGQGDHRVVAYGFEPCDILPDFRGNPRDAHVYLIIGNGSTLWIPAELKARYDALGAWGGLLRKPRAAAEYDGDVAVAQRFEGGGLFRAPGGNAYEVHGSIYTKYGQLGTWRGSLGFPLSDEESDGFGGRVSQFEHGAIYYSRGIGARVLNEPEIEAKWLALRGRSGWLGPLVSDEQDGVDGSSRVAHFENGVIVWTEDFGAFALSDELYEDWLDRSAAAWMEAPVADERGCFGDTLRTAELNAGFIVRVPLLGLAFGDWIGQEESGRISGSVHVGDGAVPNGRTFSLSNACPIVTQPALAASGWDNRISSLSLQGLTRASVYFFTAGTLNAGQNLYGHFIKVSGASSATVVPRIDNDISSFMLANHGAASLRFTLADLRRLMTEAVGAVPGFTPVSVRVWPAPGRRGMHFEIDADYTDPLGLRGAYRIQFRLRPEATDQWVFELTRSPMTVTSRCGGCGLAPELVGRRVDEIREAFRQRLFGVVDSVRRYTVPAYGARYFYRSGLRRVNVLPDMLEFVVTDDDQTMAWLGMVAMVLGDRVAFTEYLDVDRDAEPPLFGIIRDVGL